MCALQSLKSSQKTISNVHPEFEGMGLSAIDTASGIVAGRPYGGLAILIRKDLRKYLI